MMKQSGLPITTLSQLLGGIALGLLLIGGFDRLTRTPLPEPMLALTEVERTLAPEDGLPAADAQWDPVSLPDDAPHRGGGRQHAWYRFRFDLPAQRPELWALLLQRPLAAVRIHINGQLLADSGIGRSRLPEYRHDLRYNLSPGMLREGHNELLILSVSVSRRAGLGQVWLGDSGRLAAYKSARNRIEKDWPGLALQVISVLAVMLAAFQAVRPQETAFGWFSAALGGWAVHTALAERSTALFGLVGLHQSLVVLGLVWFVIFGLLFVHRLMAQHAPLRERAALGFGILASVLLLGLSPWRNWPIYDHLALWLIVPGVLLLGGLILFELWRAAVHGGNRQEARWLLPLAAVLLVIGVRDWMLDLRWIGNWQSLRYLPFAAPIVFVVFGALLLRRHAQALAAVEQVNRTLEQKVAEKSRAIEANWRRMAEIEGERARYDERDRLMRDMHDGVGGHLVQALALAEQSGDHRLSEAIRNALDDLRLLIDASDVHSEGLNDILARLRERLGRRLAGLGIELEWDFTRSPALPRLSPHDTIQILRVLQEAVTNIIKHAAAGRVSIAAECLDDPASGRPVRLLFEVADDGRGFDLRQTGEGRGLRNLAARIAALDGQWHLDSRLGHGSRLRFDLPLRDSHDAAPADKTR
jgi:signal transduction histidine kinase